MEERNNITNAKTSRNIPSLASLRNPTLEFLNSNYRKPELQKYCGQIGLSGLWTTKNDLIDKLLVHYSSKDPLPSASRMLSPGHDQDSQESQESKMQIFIHCSWLIDSRGLLEKQTIISMLLTMPLRRERERNTRTQNKNFPGRGGDKVSKNNTTRHRGSSTIKSGFYRKRKENLADWRHLSERDQGQRPP